MRDCRNHRWGPVENARITGNPHRKCQNDCDFVSLDLGGCDCGSEECSECGPWLAEHRAWVASLPPADRARWGG